MVELQRHEKREIMGFYDLEKNVNAYIDMAKGFDGRELIEILKKYVPKGVSVLELGMGPGVDLEILSKTFNVTGSDASRCFIDRFKKMHPDIEVLELDVKNINIERKFDCIYSNKVLHHLNDEELKNSLIKQKEILNDGGILFHTFWLGDKQESMEGMLFNYVTKSKLQQMVKDHFEIVIFEIYKEMEDDDSVYMILRKTI